MMWRVMCLFLFLSLCGRVLLGAEGDLCVVGEMSLRRQGGEVVWSRTGKPLVAFGGLDLKWVPGKTELVSVEAVGEGCARGVYRFGGAGAERLTAEAHWTLTERGVALKWELRNPDRVKLAGMMYARRVADGKERRLVRSGLWRRRAEGGEPYEERGAVFWQETLGDGSALFEQFRGHAGWSNGTEQHLQVTEGDGGLQVAEARWLFRADGDGELASAELNGQRLSLGLRPGREDRLWEAGQSPVWFELKVGNPSATEARTAHWRVEAHDWRGRLVLERSGNARLAPGACSNVRLELPGSSHNQLYVVEARVREEEGAEPYLARLTMGVLEPFVPSRPSESLFGVSAWFPVPSREAALSSLRRLGVCHLRTDSRESGGGWGSVGHHTQYRPRRFEGEDAAERRLAWMREQLSEARSRGAVHWEFGNETRFKSQAEAEEYVRDWLVPLRRLRDAEFPGIRILSIGFANGFDGIRMLDMVAAAGGWELLDGVAYHLGRGCFAPDAPGFAPWNYYDSLSELADWVRRHGQKPIYLTEVYCKTKPHDSWSDTQRQAAENVALTYALALRFGVRVAYYYQHLDSVWANVGGVNPKDVEYHFGLFYRDGSPKAVAIAYQMTARMLDGATFVRELSFPGQPELRGLLFRTQSGDERALIWSRAEGGLLNEKAPGYVSGELWERPWRVSTPVRLTARGTLRVRDVLGCPVELGEEGTVQVTGAPLWVEGANFRKESTKDTK
ncbi:MAG: hypothetical protein ACI4WT_12880 [Oligosphaeraceae bacterium]